MYHERWELEPGLDEVKTEMLEREAAIRSQKVDGVEQERWGLLLAFSLVRLEMGRVADEANVPPTRISVITAFHYIRHARMIADFIKPGALPTRVRRLRPVLRSLVLPPRRSERIYPRAVKFKMSNYLRKQCPSPQPLVVAAP